MMKKESSMTISKGWGLMRNGPTDPRGVLLLILNRLSVCLVM